MKVKGVNLGNWLVLEKWMNPALFAGTTAEDEYWPSKTVIKRSVHRAYPYSSKRIYHRERFCND